MAIKPIETEAGYRAALKEIESPMMAVPDTPEGEKLDVLFTLVDAYEAGHYPIDLPDPVAAIIPGTGVSVFLLWRRMEREKLQCI